MTNVKLLNPRKIVSLALCAGLGACHTASPNFDSNFGKSVIAARQAQLSNPKASIENQGRSVDGIEGRTSRESIHRYHQSFVEPPPPVNVFNIGVGDAR